MKTQIKENKRWRIVETLGVSPLGLPMAGAEYYHLVESEPKTPEQKWRKVDHMGTLLPKRPKHL